MTDFQKYSQDQITDDVLQEAAELFSNHYGVWAKRASKCVRSKIEEGRCLSLICKEPCYNHLRQSCKDEQTTPASRMPSSCSC